MYTIYSAQLMRQKPVFLKKYYIVTQANVINFPNSRVGTKISMIYINDIYHDSIVIFSSENIMIFLIFLIFSKYQPLLYYY